MDPRIAIKERIRELKAELATNERALALYTDSTPVAKTAPTADNVRATFAKMDNLRGLVISEVAKEMGLTYGEVAMAMKPKGDYVQVNKPAKQNKRYRLKTLVEPPTEKVEKVREAKGIVQKPERKQQKRKKSQPKRTSGMHITSGLGKETRDTILKYLKENKRVTARLIAEDTGMPAHRAKAHLDQLVDAEAVKNLGPDPHHKRMVNGKPQGAPPLIYESLIYEGPSNPSPYRIHIDSSGASATPYPKSNPDNRRADPYG